MTQTRDLIPASRIPHKSLRTAEEYLKRQTFRHERATVLSLLALYRDAYRDLALVLSSQLARTEAETRVNERVNRLRRDALALLALAYGAALLGGYYGKLWLLDVSTREDVPVNVRQTVAQLDEQFRAQVAVELDALAVDVRRVLVAGAVGALALRRLRRVMGADSSSVAPRGSFNRVQVLARTGVQSAVNTGALVAMQQNGQLVTELEWLTTRDERVCPECAPRDGKRYPLDTLELPPLHPQCRCTLVPVLDDDLLTPPTVPLRTTLAEWARTLGVLGAIAGFLRP